MRLDALKPAQARILARVEELPVDPYALMNGRVLEYAQEHMHESLLALIRLSAYYKVRGPLDPEKLKPGSPKVRLLKRMFEEWGWETDKIRRLDSYSRWSDRDQILLGQKMKSLLFNCIPESPRGW